jgi:MFS family permease
MLRLLRQRGVRHLLAAQLSALFGTGLATVALGLLAHQLAGAAAGAVLGTALAIKMLAYVALAPAAAAAAARLPRRALLVGLDLARALVVLGLPFVTAVWQVYLLVALLQAAAAAHTPAFQATLPDVLPAERDYTRALSLSQLAADVETLLSPLLAAAVLTVASFDVLFVGTAAGLAVSALLVATAGLPERPPAPAGEGAWAAATKGIRIMIRTPRLRGALALELAVAAAGAMVLVNSVVIVRVEFGLADRDVALALAGFGGGSMLAALLTPALVEARGERPVMLGGGAAMVAGLAAAAAAAGLAQLTAVWAVIGFGFGLTQTPIGRLLVRSAQPEDRPAVFAAQFALSHGCWLIAYPLAGQVGARLGLGAAFAVLTLFGGAALGLAWVLWPIRDPDRLPHLHPELPPDHPHLREHEEPGGHPYRIDRLHRQWPRSDRLRPT